MQVETSPWFALYMLVGIIYGSFLLWEDLCSDVRGTKRTILVIAFVWILLMPYLVFWKGIKQLRMPQSR